MKKFIQKRIKKARWLKGGSTPPLAIAHAMSGALLTNDMTIFEFVEQLCDIIGGEDAYYRFEKDELIDMCKAMSESHRKAEEEIAEAV